MEEEEEYLIIGGDFNAKTGNKGGPIELQERKEMERRKSWDTVVNKEGKVLLREISERGWMISNGSYGKEGRQTFVRDVGSSVIDYVLANKKAWAEVKSVEEGIRIGIESCLSGG